MIYSLRTFVRIVKIKFILFHLHSSDMVQQLSNTIRCRLRSARSRVWIRCVKHFLGSRPAITSDTGREEGRTRRMPSASSASTWSTIRYGFMDLSRGNTIIEPYSVLWRIFFWELPQVRITELQLNTRLAVSSWAQRGSGADKWVFNQLCPPHFCVLPKENLP